MNDQEILEALKKSVAMPPVLCMKRKKPYCEKCGQKIKWTAGEEEQSRLVTVNTSDTEYTVLAKRIDDGRYVQLGGVFGNELLCRKRFEEKVRNREIFYGIDLSTAVFAKRETVALTEEWEAMGNVDLEM